MVLKGLQTDSLTHHGTHFDFDETRDKDLLVFGSPATVRAEIERCLETIDTNYFVARFAHGSLSYDQSKAALDLFAEEVMPHFAAL